MVELEEQHKSLSSPCSSASFSASSPLFRCSPSTLVETTKCIMLCLESVVSTRCPTVGCACATASPTAAQHHASVTCGLMVPSMNTIICVSGQDHFSRKAYLTIGLGKTPITQCPNALRATIVWNFSSCRKLERVRWD